jgi:hypothetical protein
VRGGKSGRGDFMGKESCIELVYGFEEISLFVGGRESYFIVEKSTGAVGFGDGTGGFTVPETGDVGVFH